MAHLNSFSLASQRGSAYMPKQSFSKFVRPEAPRRGAITGRDLDIFDSVLRYRFCWIYEAPNWCTISYSMASNEIADSSDNSLEPLVTIAAQQTNLSGLNVLLARIASGMNARGGIIGEEDSGVTVANNPAPARLIPMAQSCRIWERPPFSRRRLR